MICMAPAVGRMQPSNAAHAVIRTSFRCLPVILFSFLTGPVGAAVKTPHPNASHASDRHRTPTSPLVKQAFRTPAITVTAMRFPSKRAGILAWASSSVPGRPSRMTQWLSSGGGLCPIAAGPQRNHTSFPIILPEKWQAPFCIRTAIRPEEAGCIIA